MPNWAAIIGYSLARGRSFYSNDVILLHQVTVPFHQGTVPLFELHQILSNDMKQNCISSETHNWHMYQTWEIETPNLGFKQMVSQEGVRGQNILLILAPMWNNNLWSVCHYIMGPFGGWWRLGGNGNRPHLKMYVRNRWSPIHISNRFTSKLHILHKSDNIVH